MNWRSGCRWSAPELLDFARSRRRRSRCTASTKSPPVRLRTNCLLARRMVERGVRFVMLMHASWDQHTELESRAKKNCDITDQPTAALIKDLKQRGLLDSTLVVWGGEFGRTPMVRKPEHARSGERRARPSPIRLQHVPGRGRYQGRPGHRKNGRPRIQHPGGQGTRPRSPGDAAALPRTSITPA